MPKKTALALALDTAADNLDYATADEAKSLDALHGEHDTDDGHDAAYIEWAQDAAKLAAAESFYNNVNALDIRRKREAREEAGDA